MKEPFGRFRMMVFSISSMESYSPRARIKYSVFPIDIVPPGTLTFLDIRAIKDHGISKPYNTGQVLVLFKGICDLQIGVFPLELPRHSSSLHTRQAGRLGRIKVAPHVGLYLVQTHTCAFQGNHLLQHLVKGISYHLKLSAVTTGL